MSEDSTLECLADCELQHKFFIIGASDYEIVHVVEYVDDLMMVYLNEQR